MGTIVAIGELLVDLIEVSQDEEGYPLLQAKPGGAPANLLAAAARCGQNTALIAQVGDDVFGRSLCQTLQRRGIDTQAVTRNPEVFTTLAFVTLNAQGERSFSFARKPGADTALSPDEVPKDLIAQSSLLHFGSLSLTNNPARDATVKAVAQAQEAGRWISFDPNYRASLWPNSSAAREAGHWGFSQSTIVKISEEEADFYWSCSPEKALDRLLEESNCSLVFCALGAEGAYAATSSIKVKVDCPFEVIPRDTTGAGDIFTGSALSALLYWVESLSAKNAANAPTINPIAIDFDWSRLDAETLKAITGFACAMASVSTTLSGGLTSIPEPSEIAKRLSIL